MPTFRQKTNGRGANRKHYPWHEEKADQEREAKQAVGLTLSKAGSWKIQMERMKLAAGDQGLIRMLDGRRQSSSR
jgi:hypothetical protein